jgi:hypothetical protein
MGVHTMGSQWVREVLGGKINMRRRMSELSFIAVNFIL